jgi:RNA polymerase sigma factor (sigma-70 family)
MVFHPEQLKIIKDMIVEYQVTQDKDVFFEIIKRMDRMLVETVMMFSRQYKIRAPIQDIYQTGILGLAKAVNKFKTNYKETAIPKCVLYWVRLELLDTYRTYPIDGEKYKAEHPEEDKTDITDGLIQEDIRQVIENCVTSGKLTDEDVCLLILIYIENMPVSEIFNIFGTKWGKTYTTINKRVATATRILKKEFIINGFGE